MSAHTFPRVTRVEFISDNGREFVKWGDFRGGVYLELQDDGQTLKVFTGEEIPDGSA